MPMFIATALLPLITNSPIFFLGPAAISATATGLGYLATAAALFAVQTLLTPKPDIPKAEDGTYNLKQAVPSPAFVLGRAKKGGDYLALEEKRGIAYHVIAMSARRINQYVSHFLHDEEVLLDGIGDVTYPGHFDEKVRILTRVGLDAETAFAIMITETPEIWTPDHRGDGLATVLMRVESVNAEDHQETFPQNMPVHTAVVEGMFLYDPREIGHNPANPNTWTYSDNLALERLWHLTDPVGSKLTLADMYLPEWVAAANICDELITLGSFPEEARYRGGFWFRASDDPIAVGRTMDQAADMIIYERPDGQVGVHPGVFVEPDIRLTADDILSCNFDANRRLASTVLAVRGRFTYPERHYSEYDSPIIGNPYQPEEDSTERTKTIQNSAVQSMSHMLRLQLLAYKRANSPRVRITAHWEVAKNVPYRRFIRVHLPPRMNEAVIEIVGRPQLSLKALTYTFEGFVVDDDLYEFDYPVPTPPPPVPEIEKSAVPVPINFNVFIEYGPVAGTLLGSFGRATWDAPVTDTFLTEVEYQELPSGPTQTVRSVKGALEVKTGILVQGVSYRFRARNWSSAVPSEWTDYETMLIQDPTPPSALTSFTAQGGNGHAVFNIGVPSGDPHMHHINVYRVPTGVPLDKNVHAKITVNIAGTSFSFIDGDNSVVTSIVNGLLLLTPPPPTLGTNWVHSTGQANHTTGAGGSLSWPTSPAIVVGATYRTSINILSFTGVGATLQERWTGGTTENIGAAYATGATGVKLARQTAANPGNTAIGFLASTTAVVSVTEMIHFRETALCAPQGFWDYYAFPANGSDIEGTGATPVLNIRIV